MIWMEHESNELCYPHPKAHMQNRGLLLVATVNELSYKQCVCPLHQKLMWQKMKHIRFTKACLNTLFQVNTAMNYWALTWTNLFCQDLHSRSWMSSQSLGSVYWQQMNESVKCGLHFITEYEFNYRDFGKFKKKNHQKMSLWSSSVNVYKTS
jgi:hypothetical protein